MKNACLESRGEIFELLNYDLKQRVPWLSGLVTTANSNGFWNHSTSETNVLFVNRSDMRDRSLFIAWGGEQRI